MMKADPLRGNPQTRPKRILLEVSHPAHVHFFRPLAHVLMEKGAEVHVAGRQKDVTLDLLTASGLPFSIISSAAAARSRAKDARELAMRVVRLRRLIRSWRPDVLLTRNPSGVIAAVGSKTWTVFDTDDGSAVGLHYRLGAPLADITTSSLHDPESHGSRHLRYPALKAHAFLHPARFHASPHADGYAPSKQVRRFVVRWSRHDASHDNGIDGLDVATRHAVVQILAAHGDVVVSEEGHPPRLISRGSEARTLPVGAFHALLASASLCVTDGQAVAAEAAVLGVHTLRLSGFTGAVWYLTFLEHLGLIMNFAPGQESELLAALEVALQDRALQVRSREQAARLNGPAADLTEWFAELTLRLASSKKTPRFPFLQSARTVPGFAR